MPCQGFNKRSYKLIARPGHNQIGVTKASPIFPAAQVSTGNWWGLCLSVSLGMLTAFKADGGSLRGELMAVLQFDCTALSQMKINLGHHCCEVFLPKSSHVNMPAVTP